MGLEMYCGIADAKGEDGFKEEPSLIKVIVNLSTDINWKIRQ